MRSLDFRFFGRVSWKELVARVGAVAAAVTCLAATPDVRAEKPRETPQEDPRRSTASRTVVTREEIESRQWRTLVELLQGQPGLHVSQLGGVGQPAQIFLRGQRRGSVLVRLDGIEISDPASKDPGTVLPDLLTVDIERVEIARGPQGVEAGNDAVGGVIDIVTRRGNGPATPWARVEAGGFGTYQSSGGIRGGSESVDYALSYTHLHSRGINVALSDDRDGERDGYENDSVGGRLDLRPTDRLRLGFTGRFVDSERGLDSRNVQLDDPTDPSPASFNQFDLHGSQHDARRLFLRGEAELSLFDDRWTQQWSVGYTDHANKGRVRGANPALAVAALDRDIRRDPFGTLLEQLRAALAARPTRRKTDADSSRLELAWTHSLRISPQHELRLGGEIDHETFRSSDLAQNPLVVRFGILGGSLIGPLEFQEDDSRISSHERAHNASAFLEDRFTFEDVFGEIGARVQDHDEFGSQTSYRVGLGYIEPRTRLKLFANFGTAFRDPDLLIAASRTLTGPSLGLLGSGLVGESSVESASRGFAMLRPFDLGFGFTRLALTDARVEAEQIRAAEIGTSLLLFDGRGELGIGVFSTRTRRIPSRSVALDVFGGVVADLAEDSLRSRARGVETWFRADVNDRLSLELDYTYTRSRLEHDLGFFSDVGTDIGGDAELGVPRHRANASLRFRPLEGVEGWLAARYVGARHDQVIRLATLVDDPIVQRALAFSQDVTRGAYTTFDVGLRWKLRSDLTLFARVENVFDREYSDPAQTNSPGRAGYIGLEVALGQQ